MSERYSGGQIGGADPVRRQVDGYLDSITWPDRVLDPAALRARATAARRLRRVRRTGLTVGALGAVAVAVMALTAGLPHRGPSVTTLPAPLPAADPTTSAGVVPPGGPLPFPTVPDVGRVRPRCGAPMPAMPGSPLLQGRPLTARARQAWGLTIETPLVNTSPVRLRGLVGTPRTAVVRDGVVVAAQLGVRSIGDGVDLEPGRSRPLTTGFPLFACHGELGNPPTPPEADWLPPGTYQVYAWTEAVANSDGSDPRIAWGGPWTLTLTP